MAGDGYLFKRGKTYWGRVRVAGREYRSTLRTTDPREAKRRLKEWRLKVERAAVIGKDAQTWEEAGIKWITEVLPGAVKPSVMQRYKTSLIPLTRIFSGIPVAAIDQSGIAEYVSSRSGQVSNATIRRDLTALSRLLAACQSWGWIKINPMLAYDRRVVVREQRDPIEPPHPEDLAYVLANAPPSMAKILRLLDQTGMRQAEAVNLTRRGVDWERQTITLTRTKSGRPRVLRWKTPTGDAAIPLADADPGNILFPIPDENGEPSHYRNFASAFGALMRRLVARAEKEGRPFRRFRAHDLRHGFAIRWLHQGGDLYELSKHLGHSSIKTTEIYLDFALDKHTAQMGAHEALSRLHTNDKKII